MFYFTCSSAIFWSHALLLSFVSFPLEDLKLKSVCFCLIRSIIRNTDPGSAKRLHLRCFPSKYWLRQRKKTTFEVFSVEIPTQAAQKDYFWGVFRRNTDSGSAKRLLLRCFRRNTDSGSAKRLLLRCFPSKYWLRQRKKTTFYVFSVEILTQAAQKDYFLGVFRRNTDAGSAKRLLLRCFRRCEKRVFVTIISEQYTKFLESILRNVFPFFLRRFSLQNLKKLLVLSEFELPCRVLPW